MTGFRFPVSGFRKIFACRASAHTSEPAPEQVSAHLLSTGVGAGLAGEEFSDHGPPTTDYRLPTTDCRKNTLNPTPMKTGVPKDE